MINIAHNIALERATLHIKMINNIITKQLTLFKIMILLLSYKRWVAKYGGVLRYYNLLGRECVLVADPEALKRIFVTHQQKYGRPSPKTIPYV